MTVIQPVEEEAGVVVVERGRTAMWLGTMAKLFKLRIVMLLLLASFGGAALGVISGGIYSGRRLLVLTITGILSAGGASAINQYLEIDRDRQMRRTANRPLINGQIQKPRRVLYLACGMVITASLIAVLSGLAALAFWLFAGAAIYVAVYTVWLKPRTALNIVIGGAAGSCAVIAGGAAMGVVWSTALWILAGLIFVWTPVHFWALALAYREDYQRAAYPMLPGLVSPQTTARWIGFHAVLTAGLALALGLWPGFDLPMTLLMGLITLPLIYKTVQLWVQPERKTAFALFHASNLFLAAVLMAVMLSSIWRI